MHDRDLASRAAEADESELQPEAEGLSFGRLRRVCQCSGLARPPHQCLLSTHPNTLSRAPPPSTDDPARTKVPRLRLPSEQPSDDDAEERARRNLGSTVVTASSTLSDLENGSRAWPASLLQLTQPRPRGERAPSPCRKA